MSTEHFSFFLSIFFFEVEKNCFNKDMLKTYINEKNKLFKKKIKNFFKKVKKLHKKSEFFTEK